MKKLLLLWFALLALPTLVACADVPAYQAPRVDSAVSTQKIKSLAPRKLADRIAVSIYEFRSSVTEIPVRGATDMFQTALVKSGQFRVVERARLTEGVVKEKQLNVEGLSSGAASQTQLRDAKYFFRGIDHRSEPDETQRSGTLGVGGAEIGAGGNNDAVGIDARVIEVASGDVIDVVTVRKTIASDSNSVSGIGALLGTVLAQKGISSPYTPDLKLQQQRKESLDVALRAAIDEAVIELANKF